MKPLLAMACVVLSGTPAAAQWKFDSVFLHIPPDIVAVDAIYGFTAGEVPGQDPWWGVRLEYDLPPSPWGFELGYAYRGKQYYSFNHGSNQWSGPMPWPLVNSGGVSEDEWPFFQTRHILSPGVVYRGEWRGFRPRLALGLLVQFFLPGDAEKFYGDFQESFRDYLGTTRTIFGNSLKFGIDGNFWTWLQYGADFVFEVPDWAQFYDSVQYALTTYVQTNAHFELRLGVRL